MELFSFAVVTVMAIRCISFGVATVLERNFVGGVTVIALAIGSVVCAMAVFY